VSNQVYPLYKQSVMSESDVNNGMDQSGSNAPFAALITTSGGYTYSAAHQFYSSLTNIVGTPQPITSNTVTNGLFSGSNVTFTTVSGTVVGALVIYRQNGGANTTWRLVLYEDTSISGLPLTPNGGNVVITWSGAGIFQLSDADAKHSIRSVGRVGPAEIVSYCYRDETKRRVGLIAQQVETFAPHAVRRLHGKRHVDYAAAFAAVLGGRHLHKNQMKLRPVTNA
jgi:endosialidase-like protein